MQKIDFGKLLGFDVVADQVSHGLDFQSDTVGSRLGAKVGAEPLAPSKLDYSMLLGFDTVAVERLGNLDLQDETVAAKLGAKVGIEPRGSTESRSKS